MQIGRAVVQQPLEQFDGLSREPINLVEHEQAGSRVQLDCTGKHPDLIRGRQSGPGVGVGQHGQVEPGALPRVSEVAPEHARGVVLVERDPRHNDPLFAHAASEVREQGRLAETGPGACRTVSLRSRTASRRCRSASRGTYPAPSSGVLTFAFKSQDGATLDIGEATLCLARPIHHQVSRSG